MSRLRWSQGLVPAALGAGCGLALLVAVFASGYVGVAVLADHGHQVVSGDCGTDEFAVDRQWSCKIGPLPIPRWFASPFGALVVLVSLGLIPVAIVAVILTLVGRLVFKPDTPREHAPPGDERGPRPGL